MPDVDRRFHEVIAGASQAVVVAVANCDHRLSQYQWASLCWALHSELEAWISGEWAADPVSAHQGASWLLRFAGAQEAGAARALVATIAARAAHPVMWMPVARTEVI